MDHADRNLEKEKFELDSAEFELESAGPLPDCYGDNRLVILPRDPKWFFAYWEFTPDRAERLRQELGGDVWEKGTLVLRVYDVSGAANNGPEGMPFFDIDILDRATRNWYVNVPQSGRTYQAQLGLRLPDGRFLVLLRSNRVRLPYGQVSDVIETEWMAVNVLSQEEWTRISGVQGIGKGSAEFSRAMAMRWEFLRSVFSLASSMLSMPQMPSSMPSSFSSSNVSSSSVWSTPPEVQRGGK